MGRGSEREGERERERGGGEYLSKILSYNFIDSHGIFSGNCKATSANQAWIETPILPKAQAKWGSAFT